MSSSIESQMFQKINEHPNSTEVKPVSQEDIAKNFYEKLEGIKKKIVNSQKMLIASSDDKCNVSFDQAITHAACVKLLSDKLRESSIVYIYVFFNNDINAAVVYMNNVPDKNAVDSICVWRANKAIMNRIEIAETFGHSLACILTSIGYEVFINDATEPFTSFLKGKEENADRLS